MKRQLLARADTRVNLEQENCPRPFIPRPARRLNGSWCHLTTGQSATQVKPVLAQHTVPVQQSLLAWHVCPGCWQHENLHVPAPPLGPAQQRVSPQQSALSRQAAPAGSHWHMPCAPHWPLQHCELVEQAVLA